MPINNDKNADNQIIPGAISCNKAESGPSANGNKQTIMIKNNKGVTQEKGWRNSMSKS